MHSKRNPHTYLPITHLWAMNNILAFEWSTILSPLEPAYNIVVWRRHY